MTTDEIKALLEGVTEGPWEQMLGYHGHNKICATYDCINGLSALFTIAEVNVPADDERGYTDDAFNPDVASANARFIAASRQIVPDLLAQIAALQARVAELEAGLTFYADVSKYPAPLTGGAGDLYFDGGETARALLKKDKPHD